MSVHNVVQPVYALACDQQGCPNRYESADWDYRYVNLRNQAAAAGWRVRPTAGPGSRSAPDLCPDCRTLTAQWIAVFREAGKRIDVALGIDTEEGS